MGKTQNRQARETGVDRPINGLVRMLIRAMPYMSRRFMHFLANMFACIALVICGNYRRRTAHNLRFLFPRDSAPVILFKVYRIFRNFAHYFVDLFVFSFKPGARLQDYVDTISNWQQIDQALGQGRGLLLATAHLGNWEMGGFLLQEQGYPLNILYLKDRFSAIEQHRSVMRATARVREIPVGRQARAVIPVLKALRANEIVGLQIDRVLGGKGIEAPFLSGSYTFPAGPALLAITSGAPLVPAFIYFGPKFRYQVILGEPVVVPKSGDRERDIHLVVQRLAAVLEGQVRAHPYQWYCFDQAIAGGR